MIFGSELDCTAGFDLDVEGVGFTLGIWWLEAAVRGADVVSSCPLTGVMSRELSCSLITSDRV